MTEKERRAFNRGIEAAAKMADLWADENARIADHTIMADPIINLKDGRRVTPREIQDAMVMSVELAEQGHNHATRFHTAKAMAAMIRDLKVQK